MDNSCRRIPIALFCFLPDTGHVLPLLRLAKLVSTYKECQVTCFLQSKFESIVREYGFEYFCLNSGPSQIDGDIFIELSRKSIFYNSFSNYMDLNDSYWSPLRCAISSELSSIVSKLKVLQPHYLLCDSHIFSDYYERLAAGCGARLIVNFSGGTLIRKQRLYVQKYGMSNKISGWHFIVEKTGGIAQFWFRCWRIFRHYKRRQYVKSMFVSSEKLALEAFKGSPSKVSETLYVTSGLAVFEPLYATASNCLTDKIREVVIAPTVEIVNETLPGELEAWLSKQDDGQVVYVCFGTLLSLSKEMLNKLASGFIDAQVTVIWSLPRSQQDLIKVNHLTTNFRIEEFVPQAALLASPKIGCFITHGGSGGVQEAIVNGKPLLCIPFMNDQPYNSSLLIQLGVGRVLSKHNIRRRHLIKEIRELLDNPSYADAARRLAGEIFRLQRSSRHSGWIDVFLSEKQ